MLVSTVDENCSISSKWKLRMMMYSFAKVDSWYYFAVANYNGLYRYNHEIDRLEFLGCIPNEGVEISHLFGKINYLNSKLYMAPMNGQEIAVYDIKKDTFKKIELPNRNHKGERQKFYGVIDYHDKVFLIPARYESLVVIDSVTDGIDYLVNLSELTGISNLHGELWVKNGYFINDNYLYMAVFTKNIIIKVELGTYRARIISVDGVDDGFVDAIVDENKKYVWLLCSHSACVVRLDLETESTKVINIDMADLECEKYPFINILQNNISLFLIAYQANTSVCVDKRTFEYTAIDFESVCESDDLNFWGAKHYFGTDISNNTFLISNMGDNSFSIIRGGKIVEKYYLENKDRTMQLRMKSDDPVMYEKQKNTLKDYIKCI